MSNDNKDKKDRKTNDESNYKNIDLDAFGEYLNTLKSSHECPMCSNTKWTLYTPGDSVNDKGNPIVVPIIPGVTVDVPVTDKNMFINSTFTLLVMCCNNCGYLNLFSLPRVNRILLESNKDSTKQSNDNDEMSL
ncbi:hypothetical protein FBF86_05690 [Serratia marcescens]|uniref:hypothetical protein n=1 Tax=Serratia marcescens TaxID=615 RepID=UPI001154D5C4|nr:hypothetical protein [Serratia marcescens]QDI17499.1 hypothetical protein FBF86_05690 [Serratia marcescens]QDI27242.1 hypothetical protein FG169_05690 [Serratia marcescens]